MYPYRLPKYHLKSIVQNLLTNAIKYRNPEKPLVIQVRTSIYKDQVVLTIKDNGLGFDAIKNKEEMMKPFVRPSQPQ